MSLFDKFGCGNFAEPLNRCTKRWGITDPRDQARLLGQLSVESQRFTRVVENLHYSPQRLLALFQGRNGLQTLAQAELVVAKGTKAIAEAMYGMPWGSRLGNQTNQDSWDFIGRGLIMLTGRRNYGDASYGCFGNDQLLRDPKLLEQPDVAADVACWFWYNRRLSSISDVRTITLKVNGGDTALAERINETNRALGML